MCQVKLFDNTHGPLVVQAILEKGKLLYQTDSIKDWAIEIITAQSKEIEQKPDSIEAAKLPVSEKKR